jgi:hypothetical protein
MIMQTESMTIGANEKKPRRETYQTVFAGTTPSRFPVVADCGGDPLVLLANWLRDNRPGQYAIGANGKITCQKSYRQPISCFRSHSMQR